MMLPSFTFFALESSSVPPFVLVFFGTTPSCKISALDAGLFESYVTSSTGRFFFLIKLVLSTVGGGAVAIGAG